MNDHPPNDRMEAVAAGDRDPGVEAHLASCEPCRAYVARLEDAALDFRQKEGTGGVFLARLEAAVSRTAPKSRRANRWATAVYVGAPLLAAAAALVLWVRAPGWHPTERPGSLSSMRLKGVIGLAVIRERDGSQERFTGEVSVRAGDRLLAEVDLDRPLPIAGGMLGSNGEWVTLFSPTLLVPGLHFSDQAVRFDDRPTEGWVIVGDAGAVERARLTQSFDDVVAIQVRVTFE
ncbi:MAG TPA: hypothetical protein VF881_05620 [Polyangiaceae bacterium]